MGNASSHRKRVSLSNQQCQTDPTQGLRYYPINLDRYVGS